MADPTPLPGATGLTHRQILTIVGGLMMAMLLAALDQTVVVTAMRTIADDLNGLSLQAWVTTSYLITSTVTAPLYGKFGDLYGRRRLILIAMSIFIAGSVLCGLAGSVYQLAGARAIQGLGAGGLFTLVLAIVGDLVSPREQARYQGYFVAVFAFSSLLGPVVGGFFASQDTLLGVSGWRWVFLVNVPVGLAALTVVAKVLRIPHAVRRHRIDWLGAAAFTAAIAPLLVVLEQGREWGWGSPRVLALVGVGLLALVGFVLAERAMGEDALLPLGFFRNRAFAVGNAVSLVVGVGMFGGLVTLPLYLQIVKGASPTESGLMLLALTLAMLVSSVVCAQTISRTGRYKVLPVAGAALMVASLALLWTIGADTPLWQAGVYMAMFGFGLGGCTQPLVIAVQNSLPSRHLGIATGSVTFFRQVGGTIGAAVFLSLLFATVRERITAAARTPEFLSAVRDPAVRADPANQPVVDAVDQGRLGELSLENSSFIGQLDPRLAKPFQIGFAESMSGAFLIAFAVVLIGFVLALFLKELPLSAQSGIAAREEEQADADSELAA
ncbi:MAG: MDR family MFS transporter [Micromonosporaceae bacterium]